MKRQLQESSPSLLWEMPLDVSAALSPPPLTSTLSSWWWGWTQAGDIMVQGGGTVSARRGMKSPTSLQEHSPKHSQLYDPGEVSMANVTAQACIPGV